MPGKKLTATGGSACRIAASDSWHPCAHLWSETVRPITYRISAHGILGAAVSRATPSRGLYHPSPRGAPLGELPRVSGDSAESGGVLRSRRHYVNPCRSDRVADRERSRLLDEHQLRDRRPCGRNRRPDGFNHLERRLLVPVRAGP